MALPTSARGAVVRSPSKKKKQAATTTSMAASSPATQYNYSAVNPSYAPYIPAAPTSSPANITKWDPNSGLAPPILPTSEAERIAASADYGTAEAGVNRSLYEAALRYGDPSQIASRAGAIGVTPPASNETSLLSSIARQEQEQRKQLEDVMSTRGTLSSSIHLTEAGKLGDEAARSRQDAFQEWQAAEAKLQNLLDQARNARDRAKGGANAKELEAAMATTPQDPGPPPGATGLPPQSASGQFVNNEPGNPRFGQAYTPHNTISADGKYNLLYNVYATGPPILVSKTKR